MGETSAQAGNKLTWQILIWNMHDMKHVWSVFFFFFLSKPCFGVLASLEVRGKNSPWLRTTHARANCSVQRLTSMLVLWASHVWGHPDLNWLRSRWVGMKLSSAALPATQTERCPECWCTVTVQQDVAAALWIQLQRNLYFAVLCTVTESSIYSIYIYWPPPQF